MIMNICDICKDINKKAFTFAFNYKFMHTHPSSPIFEREGGVTIDLCTECIPSIKDCDLIEVIFKGINESKLQGILNHFKQSAQTTYTKEAVIQTIETFEL